MAKQKKHVVYKMIKSAESGRGQIVKYGVTNDPGRRERENIGDGLGDRLEVVACHKTREDAKAHERNLIQGFERRNNERPPGNKQG